MLLIHAGNTGVIVREVGRTVRFVVQTKARTARFAALVYPAMFLAAVVAVAYRIML